ncbi:MAG: 3-oxoacyl-ACP synthase [Clostridia bacterium]|jgi:3-oxoacyl-[acyl-carrier-protein] synthase III|uniref:3-oxoacyl-ACP synthase III family protein n=1 Tax=Petroclostridium xylanilyticum TaxID=1792311 RepID=UPI000B992D64|nr:3-oxoacyl-ACP synthase III family protein [Petroclostridium xylanilyticum]MBZ4646032.1 3-oxoacyl-ACP synthase [Clostridia bacterium]
MWKNVRLAGTGSYLPGQPIKFDQINDYLGQLTKAPVKLQKWIEKVQPLMAEMLGVEYVYYAFNNKTRTFDDDNLSLSVKAAKLALEDAGMEAKDIDLLIYGGNYSEQMPAISTRIQEELAIEICGEFHIHANCTSVYKAIKLAHTYLQTGEYKNALVVSSCVSSSFFVPEFYNQEKVTKEDIFLRWYLCDGGGAFVLTADDEKKKGFYLENTYIESAGGKKKSAMGNRLPYHWNNPLKNYEEGAHHIRQVYLNQMEDFAHTESNGKTIFYNALKRMLALQNIDLTPLKYFVINMPSKSVREHIMQECTELGIGLDKFYSAVEQIGYPGPPAAIMSIDYLLKNRSFENGDLIFSFVMEVSKFMQAGFTLKYVE